jgi:peptidoglycan/xylan/chitin deacetylase (PgdA/CDA1 family)
VLCSVSVDLDEIPNYFAIHGLTPPEAAANAVYDLALGRLRDFATANRIPLTLFAIGADVRREENARGLRAMAELGHEIANHSLDHRYELTRLTEVEMRLQVAGAIEILSEKTGTKPSGFRAPGYTTTDALYRVPAVLSCQGDRARGHAPQGAVVAFDLGYTERTARAR